jgi:cobalamin transport system substrate-binding protein
MTVPFARVFAALLLCFSFLTACGSAPPQSVNASPSITVPSASPRFPLTVADDRGKSITFTAAPKRIVSVAPSSTEIVFALGAGDRLVAVDDFSDYPAAAKALPKVGGFKASPEKIVSFQPDLVLATTTGDLATVLESQSQRVIVQEPRDIEAVYQSIVLIGQILDRDSAARDLVQSMRMRISAVGEKTKAATKVRVLHELDATDPTKIFVAGPRNFIDAMIGIAGGTNVAASAATSYPQLSSEEIIRADPQVIVLSDAGFGGSPEVVRARPGWSAISAVKSGQVYPIDPDIVSRPGPRLADAVESYAKLLHPELFK